MTARHHIPSCHEEDCHYVAASNSRRGSTSSSSDEDDLITPCPLERQESRPVDAPPLQQPRPQTQRPRSWRDEIWHFNPLDSEGDDVDPSMLWRTMLAIERAFGCYNSARMRAALEMGDHQVPVPSKTCLDLLNDSITQLPEDARRQLADFLNNESSGPRRRSTSSWKRRLSRGPL
ncbi:hypothetical protein CONLIGDRAFT_498657 [Coniochaeta ligniaria NRRL 30616]|uniref:Uncharacterized protein n=1 Tax=Coniochaeta ligniaria NRRL 30616 TaxID=1408157 RepID=A0A1J7J8S4_9PEZI|nr:hypothetical protein CONLIGDRAFT_498657 [Coniochaeta ligniaria NRRL 30616]